jgi:hypothetical protein
LPVRARDLEERRHRRGAAAIEQTAQIEGLLQTREERIRVVRRVVLDAARTVIRHDDGDDLVGGRVALVESDDDRVVAARPQREARGPALGEGF